MQPALSLRSEAHQVTEDMAILQHVGSELCGNLAAQLHGQLHKEGIVLQLCNQAAPTHM